MSFLADSCCGLSPPAIRERRLACPEGAINHEPDMLFSVFCDADIALHTSSSRMLEALLEAEPDVRSGESAFLAQTHSGGRTATSK